MDPIDQARAALDRGEQARRDRRPADAQEAFAQAADALRGTDNTGLLADALCRQAQIARDLRDHSDAEAWQAEAVGIYRRLGDPRKLAHALRHLGEILGEAGRDHEAALHMAEMLALYRADPGTPALEMANAVRSAAEHAEKLADREAARDLWTEARDRYGRLDALFLELTGKADNPGVREATRRLERLSA